MSPFSIRTIRSLFRSSPAPQFATGSLSLNGLLKAGSGASNAGKENLGFVTGDTAEALLFVFQ